MIHSSFKTKQKVFVKHIYFNKKKASSINSEEKTPRAVNCVGIVEGNYKKKGLTFISHKMCPLGIFSPAAEPGCWRGRGTFLFMTFFHWVQQFPNSHLFNDPKTLMYHQEHGETFFLKYSSSFSPPPQP